MIGSFVVFIETKEVKYCSYLESFTTLYEAQAYCIEYQKFYPGVGLHILKFVDAYPSLKDIH